MTNQTNPSPDALNIGALPIGARQKTHPKLTGRSGGRCIGSIPDRCPPIFVHEEVLDQILDYSDRHTNSEVGGFLLGGNFYDEKTGQFIEIIEYLPATNVSSGYRSLTFTHETWARLHQQIGEQFADLQIVGWHHTHPGFGIFLSRHDEFIHRNFFSQPWQVALVVDPRKQEFGFFQWQDKSLVNSGFVCLPKQSSKRRLG